MRQVQSELEALVYMTECTLATVGHMAMLKSRKKSEFDRQIGIAQKGIDWIKAFGGSSSGRVGVIVASGISVHDWAHKDLAK